MNESYLNKSEEELLNLLEQKDYEQLTEFEKKFVESILSEKEFRERREIITSGAFIYSDRIQAIPAPLAKQRSESTSFFTKQIPMYQVMIGAAALIVFFVLIIPFVGKEDIVPRETIIVQHDTVITEKEIHDTVIRESTVPVYVTQTVYLNPDRYLNCEREEPRLLQTGPVKSPEISSRMMENKGQSLKEDATSVLLTDLGVFNAVLGQ